MVKWTSAEPIVDFALLCIQSRVFHFTILCVLGLHLCNDISILTFLNVFKWQIVFLFLLSFSRRKNVFKENAVWNNCFRRIWWNVTLSANQMFCIILHFSRNGFSVLTANFYCACQMHGIHVPSPINTLLLFGLKYLRALLAHKSFKNTTNIWEFQCSWRNKNNKYKLYCIKIYNCMYYYMMANDSYPMRSKFYYFIILLLNIK